MIALYEKLKHTKGLIVVEGEENYKELMRIYDEYAPADKLSFNLGKMTIMWVEDFSRFKAELTEYFFPKRNT